ncbi:hypothetical protein Cadr_000000090 [Camelus dromedarius]|uniref:Uncharacterized protein n=1 Tax=Camelus dromedarius TaxID=9838 RepID=A0A5N4EIG9_CAMDR|nr:hypothetical protein Cadr_000000090 [Camelus dromedarius]
MTLCYHVEEELKKEKLSTGKRSREGEVLLGGCAPELDPDIGEGFQQGKSQAEVMTRQACRGQNAQTVSF